MSRLGDLNKMAAAYRHRSRSLPPSGPIKDELRRMLAEAASNTQASADSAAAVRIASQERRA